MTMLCALTESATNTVESSELGCLAATPNPEGRRRGGDRLYFLFCRSKSEIDALNGSDREATIRGDLIR